MFKNWKKLTLTSVKGTESANHCKIIDAMSKLSLFLAAHGDAEHALEGEPIELKLDFNTPTSGPVAISYVGDMTPLKILDNNCQLQEINANSGPKSVNLPNTRAWSWVRFSLLSSDRLLSRVFIGYCEYLRTRAE